MKTLRRFLRGMAMLITMAAGIASADNIIAYSVTIPATGSDATDLSNVVAQLTSWCPGCSATLQDNIGSNAEPAGYGVTATGLGVTMAGLDAPGTVYTLQGFDILVQTTVSGSFTVSNASNGGTNATGNVHLDSYTAVSLGQPMQGPPNTNLLSNTNDPAMDIFSDGSVPGLGPDPATAVVTFSANNTTPTPTAQLPLAPGASYTYNFSNVRQNSDLGCDFVGAGGGTARCLPATYFEITPPNSLNTAPKNINVMGSDPLTFYISTATEVDTSLQGGNTSTSNITGAVEKITVTYDYTTSLAPSVPEPMTMVLMGGALVGLGLVGKHLKKS